MNKFEGTVMKLYNNKYVIFSAKITNSLVLFTTRKDNRN